MNKGSVQLALFLFVSLAVAAADGWTAWFGFSPVNLVLTAAWAAIFFIALVVLQKKAMLLLVGAPGALLLPFISFALSRIDCAAPHFTGCP